MGETRKSNAQRRRLVIAVTGALLLHVLVVMGFMLSSSATLAKHGAKGDDPNDVEGIQISLVGLHHATEPTPEPAVQTSQTEPMQAFTAMAAAAPQPTQAAFDTTVNPARSISEAIGGNPFQPQAASPPQRAQTAKGGHVQVNKRDTQTANDLWKAIAPCWQRLSDKTTQDVTLQVSFSPLGNLAKPPTILRAPGIRIDDRMTRSENQAIAALAQCGPYLMAYGQRDVKIAFPGAG